MSEEGGRMNGDWFGDRLKELREAAGLTQTQLAERAGLTKATVSRLEQGLRKEPSWQTVLALSRALGVECTAFNEEPAERPPAKMGRPPRPAGEPEPPKPAPKKPRKRKPS
jgi:transcriptional regulator with XRE-family HTH domain